MQILKEPIVYRYTDADKSAAHMTPWSLVRFPLTSPDSKS